MAGVKIPESTSEESKLCQSLNQWFSYLAALWNHLLAFPTLDQSHQKLREGEPQISIFFKKDPSINTL